MIRLFLLKPGLPQLPPQTRTFCSLANHTASALHIWLPVHIHTTPSRSMIF